MVTANLADLVALLPDWETEVAYRRQLCREVARDAWRRGYRAGYERGARVMEATWPAIVAPVIASRPDHAELELRRWGPGGREHFGDPRPGDYPGTERRHHE